MNAKCKTRHISVTSECTIPVQKQVTFDHEELCTINYDNPKCHFMHSLHNTFPYNPEALLFHQPSI